MASGAPSRSTGWFVLVSLLLVVSLGSNLYLALRMDENSRVFGRLYELLESGMNDELMAAMSQAATLETELGELRRQIDETTGDIEGVEDRLLERVKQELPPLLDEHLDRVLEARVDELRQSLARDAVREQLRDDLRQILREEVSRLESEREPGEP